MWNKFSKGFGGLGALTGGRGGKSKRYKFDVEVMSVDGLPEAVRRCCVVMARGERSHTTEVRDTRRGEQQRGA